MNALWQVMEYFASSQCDLTLVGNDFGQVGGSWR